jgi:hypothetical protein
MTAASQRRLLGLCTIGIVVTIVHLGAAARSVPTRQDTSATGPLAGTFTYGIFMDANLVRGTADFQQRVQDLQARNFTSILFTNNAMDRDEPLLDVADALGFQVIFAPHDDLRYRWWSDDVPATIDAARSVVYPIAQRSGRHPSLLGYNILDDAPTRLATKAALAVQAFREADPDHPASPVFISNNDAVYTTSRPDVILTYDYTVRAGRQPCDLTASASRIGSADLVSSIRRLGQLAGGHVPTWFVLQAHGATGGNGPLREPTTEEIRLQHWLALGEGVKGIFWFAYDSEQFWTGLRDNPALFAEVTDLAERTRPMADLLGQLSRVDDQFQAAAFGPVDPHGQPYASTLEASDGSLYVVAANRSCAPATLSISSSAVAGRLRDVEQGEVYDFGSSIPFRGGDGRLFEVIP